MMGVREIGIRLRIGEALRIDIDPYGHRSGRLPFMYERNDEREMNRRICYVFCRELEVIVMSLAPR